MRHLRDSGDRYAISTVVRATYEWYLRTEKLRRLPATVVADACETSGFPHRRRILEPSPAQQMWDHATGTPPRWGRLIITLRLLSTDDPTDHQLLPAVLTSAWNAKSEHLRQTALAKAMECVSTAADTTRERMCSALEQCITDAMALTGGILEVLTAYRGMGPLNTHDMIRAEIEAILDAPEDPKAWTSAKCAVVMTFEDEDLHGPYFDVIDALEPAEFLRLHVMAARSDALPYDRAWIIGAILDHFDPADAEARAVLQEAVLTMDWDSVFEDETVGAHLIAVRGWAALAQELPAAADTPQAYGHQTWRIVDELLFALVRGTDPTHPRLLALWDELLAHCASTTADVWSHLKDAADVEFEECELSTHQQLLENWSDQVRRLLHWAVGNPEDLQATFTTGPVYEHRQGFVEDLAILGNKDTVVLLQRCLDDTETGDAAVTAIRAIKRRLRWR
ncbi:hypothetical protein [Nocardia sp. NPDC059229]|uniref:hypothetical protein n=1 Tax=Nocardia sp. NPDC059229 TaxID=3346778 RepID=UPI0036C55DAA